MSENTGRVHLALITKVALKESTIKDILIAMNGVGIKTEIETLSIIESTNLSGYYPYHLRLTSAPMTGGIFDLDLFDLTLIYIMQKLLYNSSPSFGLVDSTSLISIPEFKIIDGISVLKSKVSFVCNSSRIRT